MNNSTVFAVKTHWNTFLCVDRRSNRLRHQLVDEIDELVLARITDDGVLFSANYTPSSDIYNALKWRQYTINYLSERAIQLKIDGWMSAEANGDITSNRGYPFEWETFFFIPMSELPIRLGQNHAHPIKQILNVRSGAMIPKNIHHIYINRQRKTRTVPEFLVEHTVSIQQRTGAISTRIWTLIDMYDAIVLIST